ncbi:MAG TPA: AAA family ATPase [Aeromicrobium sp.]|nr:AAA family ATPase [Aeromicrobium sp.]
MRLTGIRITNHSRLADLDLEVREHLVLVGPNDVGKSSVLRCLDLLLGASIAALYQRIEPADFRKKGDPLVIEGDLADFTPDDEALFPDEITVDVATGAKKLTIRLEGTLDLTDTLHVERTAPDGRTGRQISRDQTAALRWALLGASSMARDLRDDRKNVVDEILQAIDLGAEKADFDALTTQLEQTLADSTVLTALRADLAVQLTKALPEEIDQDSLTFVPGSAADADALSGVRLQITKDGANRPLSEQSDGTRALYAIALYDLVSAAANIVAIDEPEIHLHPTSQRSLALLLQASSNQKILATHSADVVGAFPPECIASVRVGGKVVQPSANFLSNDERMVVRWWVRDKLEPLTARRVLAVEGISDRIIVERAGDQTGRNLDRLGISLIETGGAGDMGAIIKLFGSSGFDVPMSMLIDEDATSATASMLGIAEAGLEANAVKISAPDLEAEYVAALGADVVWPAIQASTLFSDNERRNCATSGTGGTRTAEDVAAFCRFKSTYKVRAAMVVAPLITEATARKIASVERLLTEITAP